MGSAVGFWMFCFVGWCGFCMVLFLNWFWWNFWFALEWVWGCLSKAGLCSTGCCFPTNCILTIQKAFETVHRGVPSPCRRIFLAGCFKYLGSQWLEVPDRIPMNSRVSIFLCFYVFYVEVWGLQNYVCTILHMRSHSNSNQPSRTRTPFASLQHIKKRNDAPKLNQTTTDLTKTYQTPQQRANIAIVALPNLYWKQVPQYGTLKFEIFWYSQQNQQTSPNPEALKCCNWLTRRFSSTERAAPLRCLGSTASASLWASCWCRTSSWRRWWGSPEGFNPGVWSGYGG